jgi:BirA family biotin operon repressor/biotin-[acetyl-CoA-carboxylase] ligase
MPPFLPKIIHYDSLPSTNTEAAYQAQLGAAEGLTIVASEQTAGRGRLERHWISTRGAGLYCSIVLRPRLEPRLWTLIPLMAALSVHQALLDSFGLETDIKWPNDIMTGERKLCGILTETLETENGRAAIVGIGINMMKGAFPKELASRAISVEDVIGKMPDAERLLQSLLQTLGNNYTSLEAVDGAVRLVYAWSDHSTYAQGKRISVASGEESFLGVTRGLESDGALRVETDTGEIRIVRAGDVNSVRNVNC